jgi:hypothetical protein
MPKELVGQIGQLKIPALASELLFDFLTRLRSNPNRSGADIWPYLTITLNQTYDIGIAIGLKLSKYSKD